MNELSRRPRHRTATVVVEGEGQVLGSVFVVRCGLVSRVVRYSDLASALLAAGPDETYEARPDG